MVFIINRLVHLRIIFVLLLASINTYSFSNDTSDAMQIGCQLVAPTPQPEKYYNDLIHPCVRYSSEGIAGHHWWMVGTPYRNFDTNIENPILYYGDSPDDSIPPYTWNPTIIVQDTPSSGYNSDPVIYFEGKKLWVFWRENGTPSCVKLNYKRATFGAFSVDGYHFSQKQFFAGEKSDTLDHEMCPIFMSVNDSIKMFACYHNFKTQRIPLGMSVWSLENNDFAKSCNWMFDVKPAYKNGFDFWHFDLFKYNSKYYCVVSPESADQILLGVSDDGYNYKFWDRPLISYKNTGRTYFYKPSAMVMDGVFYLWHPVLEPGSNPRTNRLWMSSMKFDELISKLNNVVTFKSAENDDNSFFEVKVINNHIVVNSKLTQANLNVFQSTGQKIFTASIPEGDTQLNLDSGFYIIQLNNQSYKVRF